LKIAGEPDVYCGRERWTLTFTFGEAWIDIQFVAVITNTAQLEQRIKFLEIELAQYKPEPIQTKEEVDADIERFIELRDRVDEI
jgi:hypothetical protein